MEYEITHTSLYKYSDQIFLEPHTIRLIPREDVSHETLEHSIEIHPAPAGMSEIIDANGNRVYTAWFNTVNQDLRITTKTFLRTKEYNPFHFFIYPAQGQKLPMGYVADELKVVGSFVFNAIEYPQVYKIAEDLAQRARYDTVIFLMNLCQFVSNEFSYERRPWGSAIDPNELLITQKGSCRDFVTFCLAACRSMGIAARFASGYLLSANYAEQQDLHAWFEAYIPGGGWRGFDPTHGMACYHNHITLATAYDSKGCMPITGTYRGNATSKLYHSINVKQFTVVASE